MSASTSIEWTGRTWNPTTGCNKISPGCKNCYAEVMSARLKAMGQAKYRNGFALTLHEDTLDAPLSWKTPAMIFVNSMSDLFHRAVPEHFIQQVFATMRAANWHVFQVLTKRADRLAEMAPRIDWPPNVWMGVSVESQEYANERIPRLLNVPAAVRFISAEPLLGALDLRRLVPAPEVCGFCHQQVTYDALRANCTCECCVEGPEGVAWHTLDWVIVGGESGGGARQFDLAWARSIVVQCNDAGVPCFVKQIGARAVDSDPDGKAIRYPTNARKGGNPLAWPAELRVREFPEVSR